MKFVSRCEPMIYTWVCRMLFRNFMIADTEVIQGTWHRIVFELICSGCNIMILFSFLVRMWQWIALYGWTLIVYMNVLQVFIFFFFFLFLFFVHNFMLFYKCTVNNNINDERNDINNDLEISGVINFELKKKWTPSPPPLPLPRWNPSRICLNCDFSFRFVSFH